MSTDPFADLDLADLGPQPPRQCAVCNEIKPVEDYNVTKSGRRLTCRACDKSKPQRAAAEERKSRLQKGIHRLVVAARSEQPKIPTLTEVCAEMIQQFDGVKGFVEEWKSQINAAEDGTRTRLDQYKTIFQMLSAASMEKREQADLTQASEDDLEEAIASYVYQVVRPDEDDEDLERSHVA